MEIKNYTIKYGYKGKVAFEVVKAKGDQHSRVGGKKLESGIYRNFLREHYFKSIFGLYNK